MTHPTMPVLIRAALALVALALPGQVKADVISFGSLFLAPIASGGGKSDPVVGIPPAAVRSGAGNVEGERLRDCARHASVLVDGRQWASFDSVIFTGTAANRVSLFYLGAELDSV